MDSWGNSWPHVRSTCWFNFRVSQFRLKSNGLFFSGHSFVAGRVLSRSPIVVFLFIPCNFTAFNRPSSEHHHFHTNSRRHPSFFFHSEYTDFITSNRESAMEVWKFSKIDSS
ncbi:hypothetical protein SDJN03_16192, partial [Cucurbita argyrosperma subsp. sororia]